MERKTMPVHVVKLGKIQASVWANETKHGRRFNVTACRLYLENGEWKRSDSFGRDELLTAARAFHSAYDWIWTQGKQMDEEARPETVES
jgi:basic membrane lipoprotein Med (substrate-binding protein (PBP1-ABC) superfamily)